MTRPRVSVSPAARLVTLHGVPVPRGDAPLFGVADHIEHEVCAVRLDDGREVLVARKDLEVVT